MNLVTIFDNTYQQEPQKFIVTHFYDIPAVLAREYDVDLNLSITEFARLVVPYDYPCGSININHRGNLITITNLTVYSQ